MAAKLNPLFVDSTKGFGESVGTRIELSGVDLLDGEILTTRVQDNFGRDQVVTLALENGIYCGKIWLTHQQIITYEFILTLNDVVLASSTPRQLQASHMIIDEWTPVRVTPQPMKKSDAAKIVGFYEVFPETESFEDLIDKWGL